jgi:hypothetical protein
LKKQAKAREEKEKAEMAGERAIRVNTGKSTRSRANNIEPTRKKRANVVEVALGQQHTKTANLSAYYSMLSFELKKGLGYLYVHYCTVWLCYLTMKVWLTLDRENNLHRLHGSLQ